MRHDPADYISPKECAERMGYSATYFNVKVRYWAGFPRPIGRNYYWPDIHKYMQNKPERKR